MPRRTVLRLSIAAGAALLAVGTPLASAAPATDELGFVDSTARCAAPNVAVAFGSTKTSRVAVCKQQDGSLEYRGVRVSDGAKLIVTATRSDDGSYRASNEGVVYVVTSKSLTVGSRSEPWVEFHGAATASAPAQSAPPAPSSPGAAPAPATPSPTPTAPLPPPLPAEVGGR